MMHHAVRDVLYIPIHRLWSRNLDLVLDVDQVWLDEHAAWIEIGDAISREAVSVILRLKRCGGQGPDTVRALAHGLRVRSFKIEEHILRARQRELEGDGAVGMDGGSGRMLRRQLRGRPLGWCVFVADGGLSLSHGRQNQ